MGLRSAAVRVAARLAAGRVHVLVVEVPGTFEIRCVVERELERRRWVVAASPADADALLITGPTGGDLEGCLDVVWEQLPDPRVRVVLGSAADVVAAMDEIATSLADIPTLEDAAAARPAGPYPEAPDMDHGDMDHGDMEMAPHGISLAGGGQDRDGLEIDLLHLRVGPVLRWWPPGLVLTAELHGDLVAEATTTWLDDARVAADVVVTPACLLDAAAGALELAGAHRWAAEALRLRGRALAGDDVADGVEALRDRVAGSRLLRWSLGGLGVGGPSGTVRARGASRGREIDVRDRLLHLLTPVTGPADDRPLPDLVAGEELATARLLVAVSGPWAGRLTPVDDAEELAS